MRKNAASLLSRLSPRGPPVERAVQQVLAMCGDEVLLDPMELRDFAGRWYAEYPQGKACRAKILAAARGASSEGGCNGPSVLERLIHSLDYDNDGMIDFTEAARGFSILLRGGRAERAELLFSTLDIEGKGFISKEDLCAALSNQASTASPEAWEEDPAEAVSATVEAVFDVGDHDGDGFWSLEDFQKSLDQQPQLRQYFSVAESIRAFNARSTSWKGQLKALEDISAAKEASDWPYPLKPIDAARLLMSLEAFSPVAIGEFLSAQDAEGFSSRCAQYFFAELHLKGVPLDTALRRLSRRVCLTMESQKIARLLEAFADVYFKKNPGVFTERDDAYLLAISIVMLNKDAHCPLVRRKMTKEDFARLFTNVDRQMLYGIYDRIVNEEITLGRSVSKTKPPCSVASSLVALASSQLAVLMRGLSNLKAVSSAVKPNGPQSRRVWRLICVARPPKSGNSRITSSLLHHMAGRISGLAIASGYGPLVCLGN